MASLAKCQAIFHKISQPEDCKLLIIVCNMYRIIKFNLCFCSLLLFIDDPGLAGCGENCLNRLLMIEWYVLLFVCLLSFHTFLFHSFLFCG